jgi:hypothetical protein
MKAILTILCISLLGSIAQNLVREYPVNYDTKTKRWVVDYDFVSEFDDRIVVLIEAYKKMTLDQQKKFVLTASEIIKTNKPTDTLSTRWTNETISIRP